jgi:hypothetical protein
MKSPDLWIRGIEEGDKIQTKGTDNLFNRIIAENFPKLKRESPRCRKLTEHQTVRNKKDTHRPPPWHIIIKTFSTQDKERILKAAKEKRQVTYKGKPIRITADFSNQTLNTRRSRKDIIQDLKESNCQPRLVYPAKLTFLIEGKIKTFHNKEKLKEFATTKPTLQKILKGVLHIEETRLRKKE